MKNNFKIYGFIFILSVLIGSFCFASDIIDQEQTSSGGGYHFPYGYSFSQSFLPTKNNISKITTSIYTNTTQFYTLKVYSGIYNNGDLIGTETAYGQPGTFIFDYPINIIPEAYYYFTLSATTTTFKANAGSGYDRGTAYPTGYVDDLYFKTYYNDSYTPAINITYPTAGATYAGSPIPITFNYSNPALSYSQIIFNISRTSPNAQTMTPVHFYASSTIGYVDNIIFKNLINGDYNINAYFSNWNGTPHPPPTTNINFTIASSTYDDGSALIIPYDILPETCLFDISECDNISSTNFYDGITCGFKKIAIWGLCPSSEAQTILTTSYTSLKNSFPFSAFFSLTDTFTTAIGTTTLSLNNTFDMPFIDKFSNYLMLPVLASSSLPNTIGQINANLFRNSLTWILWLLASFVVFITIKKI